MTNTTSAGGQLVQTVHRQTRECTVLTTTWWLMTNSCLLRQHKTFIKWKKKIRPYREWHCPPITNTCTYISTGNTHECEAVSVGWKRPELHSGTIRGMEQCCLYRLLKLAETASASQPSLWLLLFLNG